MSVKKKEYKDEAGFEHPGKDMEIRFDQRPVISCCCWSSLQRLVKVDVLVGIIF
jgi:hypothetical protein